MEAHEEIPCSPVRGVDLHSDEAPADAGSAELQNEQRDYGVAQAVTNGQALDDRLLVQGGFNERELGASAVNEDQSGGQSDGPVVTGELLTMLRDDCGDALETLARLLVHDNHLDIAAAQEDSCTPLSPPPPSCDDVYIGKQALRQAPQAPPARIGQESQPLPTPPESGHDDLSGLRHRQDDDQDGGGAWEELLSARCTEAQGNGVWLESRHGSTVDEQLEGDVFEDIQGEEEEAVWLEGGKDGDLQFKTDSWLKRLGAALLECPATGAGDLGAGGMAGLDVLGWVATGFGGKGGGRSAEGESEDEIRHEEEELTIGSGSWSSGDGLMTFLERQQRHEEVRQAKLEHERHMRDAQIREWSHPGRWLHRGADTRGRQSEEADEEGFLDRLERMETTRRLMQAEASQERVEEQRRSQFRVSGRSRLLLKRQAKLSRAGGGQNIYYRLHNTTNVRKAEQLFETLMEGSPLLQDSCRSRRSRNAEISSCEGSLSSRSGFEVEDLSPSATREGVLSEHEREELFAKTLQQRLPAAVEQSHSAAINIGVEANGAGSPRPHDVLCLHSKRLYRSRIMKEVTALLKEHETERTGSMTREEVQTMLAHFHILPHVNRPPATMSHEQVSPVEGKADTQVSSAHDSASIPDAMRDIVQPTLLDTVWTFLLDVTEFQREGLSEAWSLEVRGQRPDDRVSVESVVMLILRIATGGLQTVRASATGEHYKLQDLRHVNLINRLRSSHIQTRLQLKAKRAHGMAYRRSVASRSCRRGVEYHAPKLSRTTKTILNRVKERNVKKLVAMGVHVPSNMKVLYHAELFREEPSNTQGARATEVVAPTPPALHVPDSTPALLCQLDKEKEARLEEERSVRQRSELEMCSFRPTICKTSEKLAKKTHSSRARRFERLYREQIEIMARRRAKIAEKKKVELVGCTFRPAVNPPPAPLHEEARVPIKGYDQGVKRIQKGWEQHKLQLEFAHALELRSYPDTPPGDDGRRQMPTVPVPFKLTAGRRKAWVEGQEEARRAEERLLRARRLARIIAEATVRDGGTWIMSRDSLDDLLLIVNVELADGRTFGLPVKRGDSPKQLAAAFGDQYGLTPTGIRSLEAIVRTKMEESTREQGDNDIAPAAVCSAATECIGLSV